MGTTGTMWRALIAGTILVTALGDHGAGGAAHAASAHSNRGPGPTPRSARPAPRSTPATRAARRSPTTARPDGGRLYAMQCASCHGVSGRGDGPDAALFTSPPRNLREGFLARYDTAELVGRVRKGQPFELTLDLTALRARATEVEALAAHLERLPTVDWRLVETGQELFVDRCEICHGPFGRPGPAVPTGVRPPRDLSDPAFQRALGDAVLMTLVRHGRKGMPAIPARLGPEESRTLVAFVRLLSPGFELYSRYCAACHGDDGRASGTFGEALRRPTVVFNRRYFRQRDPEEIRATIWHMVGEQKPAMPHFRRTLDEREVRAIVEYLKRTE